ncbi:MAG: hypothetical protein M1816_002531 [Peltula sp. TS41687]|nr:MAG: hypothetical protein M1816_002531 [Peltula sp. TS41687]
MLYVLPDHMFLQSIFLAMLLFQAVLAFPLEHNLGCGPSSRDIQTDDQGSYGTRLQDGADNCLPELLLGGQLKDHDSMKMEYCEYCKAGLDSEDLTNRRQWKDLRSRDIYHNKGFFLQARDPDILGDRAEFDHPAPSSKKLIDSSTTKSSESSTDNKQAPSSYLKDSANVTEVHHGVHREERNRKRARLESRQEMPEGKLTLRQQYNAFMKEFGQPKHREKRLRLRAGQGEPAELQRFNALRKGYNAWQSERRKKGSGTVENTQESLTDEEFKGSGTVETTQESLTDEEFDLSRAQATAYAREFARPKNKEKRVRLEAGLGEPEEVQRFNTLRNGYKRYFSALGKRRKAERFGEKKPSMEVILESGLYTEEETEQIRNLHDDYLTYARKFLKSKARRDALLSGRGTPQELKEFHRLREGYNAYRRILWRGKWKIEVDPSMVEQIEELESLRKAYNTWVKEYGGTDKQEIRTRLESGQGDDEEVERYHATWEACKAYRRLYKKLWTQIREKGLVPTEAIPEEGERVILTTEGRKRYFRPTYINKDRTKPKQSDDSVQEDIEDQSDSQDDNNQRMELSTDIQHPSGKGLWYNVSSGTSRALRVLESGMANGFQKVARASAEALSATVGGPTISASGGIPNLLRPGFLPK